MIMITSQVKETGSKPDFGSQLKQADGVKRAFVIKNRAQT